MIEKARVRQMLDEEIAKAKSIGIPVGNIMPNIEFPKATSFYGQCKRFGRNSFMIRVSEYYLQTDNEDDVRQTLMHEVLHACPDAFSDGHSGLWKRRAVLVNEIFGYHIARLGTASNSGFSLVKAKAGTMSSRNLENYRIMYCPQCGASWMHSKNAKCIKNYKSYTCGKCHCALKIRSCNDQDRM